MNPLVTIAMPVYNVEKYIERALLSALNQSYSNIEILAIDDKGLDNSIAVVNRIIAKHPRGKIVRIIDHGVNRGTGATRNTAIQEAKGEYLFFMDSDDEIKRDAIGTLVENLNRIGCRTDVVAGSVEYIDKDKVQKVGYKQSIELKGELCIWKYFFKNTEEFIVPTWNKLYSIDFLRSNSIQCIPRQLNEDAWFTFQVVLNAKNCVLDPQITYSYFRNENSACDHRNSSIERRKFMLEQYLNICNLKKEYIKRFRGYPQYEDILESVMDDCEGHCLSVIHAATYYRLNDNDGLIVRKYKIFKELILNKDISKTLHKMLSYPERISFVKDIPDNKRARHLKFYNIGKSSEFSQLFHIICGKITNRIKIK